MRRRRLVLAAACALLFGAVSPARAWQATVRIGTPYAWANAVAVDRAGNVAAGGITDLSGDLGVGAIVMLSRGGRVRWKQRLPQGSAARPIYSVVRSVHVDPHGDVIAGADVGVLDETTFGAFRVMKFDGRTGAEVWRDPVPNVGGSFVVDASGDPIVGVTESTPDPLGGEIFNFLCRRLSGSDGSERWHVEDGGRPLAVDRGGVIVDLVYPPGLAKRALADGRELWRSDVRPHRALVDAAGNVVALSDDGSRMIIVKLAGVDGRIIWQRSLDNRDLFWVIDLAADRSGDIVLVGEGLPHPDPQQFDSTFVVLKLSGRDGSDRWRVERDGAAPPSFDRASEVAIDRKGDVVVAGSLGDLVSSARAILTKLRGSDGSTRWEHRDLGGVLALTASGGVILGGGGDEVPIEPAPPGRLDGTFVVTRLNGHSGRGMRLLPVQ